MGLSNGRATCSKRNSQLIFHSLREGVLLSGGTGNTIKTTALKLLRARLVASLVWVQLAWTNDPYKVVRKL